MAQDYTVTVRDAPSLTMLVADQIWRIGEHEPEIFWVISARGRLGKAFVSWLGLSPNNKISGQRVLSSRTRKVVNRAATILRLAAMVLGHSNTPLGSFYRRKRAQLGAPKAITATARKLGCLIYHLIKNGQGYQEPDLHIYELKYKDQILNSLRKRANSFGFDLVEVPKAA